MSNEIWEANELQQDLWEVDASRAARLAYLEVLMLWGEQVEKGEYLGVPALHNVSKDMELKESHTMRSRPARYAPDSSAGSFSVPADVRARWLAAA